MTAMKPALTIVELIKSARRFCKIESHENHIELIGITDGKAVGTYVEHKFQKFLQSQYTVEVGSSAKGIDLPGAEIQTDIKVTSITQPQSSCPFKNARQKIFGLGYNLLVFVYDKRDTNDTCTLYFTHCTFISKERTADYTITRRLREMVQTRKMLLVFCKIKMFLVMILFIMILPMKFLIIHRNKAI